MRSLPKFISLLELTREQVQYGYFLNGITRQETSNLAEHHYLVAMIGWMLGAYINETEVLVDTSEITKICLIHDLGELFGGDISAPLSRKRPDLKKHAQAFERGNFEILTSFLRGRAAEEMRRLWEVEEAKVTNEAIIAKIADLIETHFFLEHRNNQLPYKEAFYRDHIRPLAQKIVHPQIRASVEAFFEGFETTIKDKGFTANQWILEEKREDGV